MSAPAYLPTLFDARLRYLRLGKKLQKKEQFQAASAAYEKAAARGSLEAMLALADLHGRGLGTPISLPRALEWYQAAARHGSTEGHFGAGCCLMRMERLPRGMRNWFESLSDGESDRAGELVALLGGRSEGDDPFPKAREHLMAACQTGHAEAHYRLAELLVRGLGGAPDPARAHDLYIVAAAAGIAGAEYGLGELYRLGSGCEGDEKTAQIWYYRAAGHGHVPAQLMVAQYLVAAGGEANLADARFWLAQACEQGAPHADYLMALTLLSSSAAVRDVEKGKHHLKRAAAKGHLHAMKQLAQIYDDGRLGEARDAFEAASWYKKVAEAGDPEAQFAIARMYARGDGVPQILSSAARWFGRSADAGHPLAAYNYAIFLERGDGLTADPVRSRHFLQSAAENGVAAAQYKLGRDLLGERNRDGLSWLEQAAAQDYVGALAELGMIHARGEVVERDGARAAALLGRAADFGHVASRVQLAAVLKANGVAMDEVLAMLGQAAEAGSTDAELMLARIYIAGDGVDRDVERGNEWLEKAAAHGHPQALFDLGVNACRGEGRPQDLVAGAQFYRKSAEAGHVVGKYNYALMVLGGGVEAADLALAKRFLCEAAQVGLAEAQDACRSYQLVDERVEGDGEIEKST